MTLPFGWRSRCCPQVRYRAKIIAQWPLEPGSFRALWLSPERRRLILRAEHRSKIMNTVWDTDTGRRLGDLKLTRRRLRLLPRWQ